MCLFIEKQTICPDHVKLLSTFIRTDSPFQNKHLTPRQCFLHFHLQKKSIRDHLPQCLCRERPRRWTWAKFINRRISTLSSHKEGVIFLSVTVHRLFHHIWFLYALAFIVEKQMLKEKVTKKKCESHFQNISYMCSTKNVTKMTSCTR